MVFDYLFFIWKKLYKWASFACQHPGKRNEVPLPDYYFSFRRHRAQLLFNLMNSGLVSHFGAMLQFGLCTEVIYAGGELLFAPVGEDNRHNKVSISFVIFPLKLDWASVFVGWHSFSAGAGMQADGNSGGMMKSLVTFSQYEVNGRNEKPIIGVEWRITVLSGSQATALSSQQFTVIRGGCEGLPYTPACYW